MLTFCCSLYFLSISQQKALSFRFQSDINKPLVFHLIFWFIISESADLWKLSLMHLLAKTIKEVLVWLLHLTQMLLGDHGRGLSHLPLFPGHLVEQDLWQMLLNASFPKVVVIFFLNNVSYNFQNFIYVWFYI